MNANGNQLSAQHDTNETMDVASRLIEEFHHSIGLGHRVRAMDALVEGLNALRTQTDAINWKPVAEYVRGETSKWTSRDLLTYRCLLKPRGYAGDAPTLDVIYRHVAAPTLDSPELVEDEALTYFVTSRPAGNGVRFRRQILADSIDATAARVPGARCLSLACGHLREAEFSRALASGGVSVLYAIDQDAESLAEVTASYPHMPIETVLVGVRELLRGARPASNLDLAYSAGLYDYLSDDVARRTTTALFDMLRPGGKLLVGNYAPTLPDIGYMESCMDWWLIHRTEAEMETLTQGIDPSLIQSIDMWKDHTGHIVYLEVTRA